MLEMAWPNEGDDAFVEGTYEATNAYPHWFDSWHRDIAIADGFKESAELVVSSLEEGNGDRHADKYLFSVGFLYRHYLEISMKQIVQLGLRLRILEPEEARHCLHSHGLPILWEKTKKVLTTFWSGADQSPVLAVEQVVSQFHAIDDTGQAFRYSTDKHGNKLLAQAPDIISLSQLRKVMDGVGNFFDGCQTGLGEALSYLESSQAFYEG